MAAGDPSGKGAENRGDFEGQATLFAAARAGVAARVESPVVDPDPEAVERRFGRGRPKGATNIASRQRLELFQRIAGDPLLQSARILAMPLATLAAELRCSLLEAAHFQQVERFKAMPYVMSARPVEVAIETKQPPALHLHFPAPTGAQLGPGGGAVALFQEAARVLGAPAAADLENDDVSEG